MTEQAISPLPRRMIEDTTIRKFAQKTQHDPRLSSFPCCVHHATAAPVFTDTPARRSEEASTPACVVNLGALLTLAAELSRGPLAAKSP
jgi:hypothetical protein